MKYLHYVNVFFVGRKQQCGREFDIYISFTAISVFYFDKVGNTAIFKF